MISRSKRRAFMIVGTGFVCFFMIYGSAYNCLGLFMKPMAESFGVPRSVISSLLSVACIFDFIFVPIAGRLFDKSRDIKWMLVMGCSAVAATYFIWANAHSIWMLYLGAFMESVGIAFTINMPIAVMIKNWFKTNQGFATGATIVGSAIGGAILSQVVTRIIAMYDWRTAYMLLGVMVLVTTIPLIMLFASKDPQKYGLYQYGAWEESVEESADVQETSIREERIKAYRMEYLKNMYTDLKTFMKTPEFFLLFLGLFFVVLPLIAVKSHMVAYLTDIGYSAQLSSVVLTVCVLAAIPGALLIGAFFDKFGTARTLIIACGCLAGGISLLMAAGFGIWIAFLFACIYGFGTMFQAVGVPLFFTDILRTSNNFATILSITGLSMTIASAIGSVLMGMVFDLTGTYLPAFAGSAMSFVIGFAFLMIAVKRAYQRHARFERAVNRREEVRKKATKERVIYEHCNDCA